MPSLSPILPTTDLLSGANYLISSKHSPSGIKWGNIYLLYKDEFVFGKYLKEYLAHETSPDGLFFFFFLLLAYYFYYY